MQPVNECYSCGGGAEPFFLHCDMGRKVLMNFHPARWSKCNYLAQSMNKKIGPEV